MHRVLKAHEERATRHTLKTIGYSSLKQIDRY